MKRKQTRYEVRRHFKDEDGYNYETLFTSNNEAEAEAFRSKLPKDNKKFQYTAIWANMTDEKLASVF